MERTSLKKKLLAVVTAAVMLFGSAQTALAATVPSDSEINKALNIKNIYIFDSDDESIGRKLTLDDTLRTKLLYFFNQYPEAELSRIFGVRGVDTEDGTRVKVRDYNLDKKSSVFQYDKKENTWKKLSRSKSDDLISFTVKSTEPIIITNNIPKAYKQKTLKLNYTTKSPLTLAPKATGQVKVTAADNNFFKYIAKKTFKSSNTSVAIVDKNGKVTAKKNGTATISVKVWNKTATCKVKVVTKATGLTLNKTTLRLRPKKGATLKATVKPKTASNKKVRWSTSDSSIATVSSTGKVKVKKGVAAGKTATITAETKDGTGIKTTCKVIVV